MKKNKYFFIVFFIIALFYYGCTHLYDVKYCGTCEEAGQWVNKGNPSSPCFKTEKECKDWVLKNSIKQECGLCN